MGRGGVVLYDPNGKAINLADPVRLWKPSGPVYWGGNADLIDSWLFAFEMEESAANNNVVDSSPNGFAGYLKTDNGSSFDDRNTNLERNAGKLDYCYHGTTLGVNAAACLVFNSVEGGTPGSIYAPAKDFTWAGWVRWPTDTHQGPANTRSTYDSLVNNWNGAGVQLSLTWYDVGGGDWRLRFWSYDGTFRGVYSSVDCSAYDDAFFHFVCTYDASAAATNFEDGAKIFVNGADVTTKIGTGGKPASFISGAWMFNARSDSNYPGRCDMDQFAGWTKPLSSALVSNLYNGGAGLRSRPFPY